MIRRGIFMVAVAAAWVCAGAPAAAFFDGLVQSSRVSAMGGAFVGVADDAAAVVINPAGMTNLYRYSLVATWHRPFGIDDIGEGFAAGAVRRGRWAWGAAWFHRGFSRALSENLLTLSGAMDLKRTAEDASLSIGASADYYRVDASGRFDGSDAALTAGVSVLLRPFPVIGIGYTIRNLREHDMDLLDGGGSTTIARAQSLGLAWYWENRMVATVERSEERGQWKTGAGIEFTLSRVVALRAGVNGGDVAAGFGVQWSGLAVDVGMVTHDALGSSTTITIGYGPPRPASPYAQ